MVEVSQTVDAEQSGAPSYLGSRAESQAPLARPARLPSPVWSLAELPRHRRKTLARRLLVLACRRAEATAPDAAT